MTQTLKIYVGYDSREDIAWQVARHSLLKHASIPVEVIPIKLDELVEQGIYTREIDPLASTEFTYSRFLTPHLAGFDGWALFCDCDFLFFGDVAGLVQYQKPEHAVACVKHDYTPKEATKMDGQAQTVYPRKNWSSVVLWNCGHPANAVVTPEFVMGATGAQLHRFTLLSDDLIGEIPKVWNWLPDEFGANKEAKLLHWTLGTPCFHEFAHVPMAEEWHREKLLTDYSLQRVIDGPFEGEAGYDAAKAAE